MRGQEADAAAHCYVPPRSRRTIDQRVVVSSMWAGLGDFLGNRRA